MENTVKLAVLIDADNAHPSIVDDLLSEIANYGTASVKRIYGDWTAPNLKGWKEVLLQHSIQPVQQFTYTRGKSATDSTMIIDAKDLLYTNNYSGFCLVSSDSDLPSLHQESESRDYSCTDSVSKRRHLHSFQLVTNSFTQKFYVPRPTNLEQLLKSPVAS